MKNNKKNTIVVGIVVGVVIISVVIALFSTGSINFNKNTNMQHYNSKVLPKIDAIEDQYRDSWNDNYIYTTTNAKNMNKSEMIQRMAWIAEDYSELSDELDRFDTSKMSKIDKELLADYARNMRMALLSRMNLAGLVINIANGETIDQDEAQEYADEAFKEHLMANIHKGMIGKESKNNTESEDGEQERGEDIEGSDELLK